MKLFPIIFSIFITICSLAQTKSIVDTLYVKPNSVIFVQPSERELDSLYKSDTTQELSEVMDDYSYYSKKVIDYLKQNKITYQISSAKYFIKKNKRESLVLNRSKLSEMVGLILIDHKGKALLLKGVDTDASLIRQIKIFYKLK